MIDANGSRWVVGLTPTVSDATALTLWRDDSVVDHAHDAEADMCRWTANLVTDRQ